MKLLLLLGLTISISYSASAQVIKAFAQRPATATPTTLIYNIRGDYTMVGNTNLTLSTYGDFTNNSNNYMEYVDVDGDPNTFNSSSAELTFSNENGAIPECSNILFAGLYWTGRASNDANSSPEEFDVTIGGTTKTFNKRKIQLKGPGQPNYTEFIANPGNIYYPDGAYGNMYSAFVEVTDYVETNGLGDYTVADMALVEGNGGGTGYYGGWGMIVVYENSKMNWRDVTIFDGHAYVQGNATINYELPVSGFNTAQAGPINMKLGVMAGEGDVGISGDYFKVRNWQDNAWVTLSHAGNSGTNFFNGSVVTGGNTRDPNLQNNTGLDIAMFDVPNPGNTVVTNNQTATRFQYGSTQDTYIIFCIAMAVDAYIPDVESVVSTETIDGIPVGAGPIVVTPGQDVEYKVQIRNLGTEPVNNAQFVVPIPYTTSFVPASIATQVNFTPLPTPNNAYYDPGVGPTGSVVWDFGTLPLPPVGFPDSVLAELTFHLSVTTDCYVLTNPDCPPQVVLTGGTTSGVGAISGAIFDMPFIQGYETAGICVGEPISDPLVLDIDAGQYIIDNCGSEPTSRDFLFCNYTSATIPFDSIAQDFPLGVSFYNENNITPTSIEYDESNWFPATPGTHTYFAIPDGVNFCYYTFTITIQSPILTTAVQTSQVQCLGGNSGAIDLSILGGIPPFTYDWSGPASFTATTQDINGLIEGGYNVIVSDSLGCTANNGATVTTILDITNPIINCPNDINVNTDSGVCGAMVSYSTPVGTDECPGATTALTQGLASNQLFSMGATLVEYTVTDLLGNSDVCSFNVTVTDNENPSITCQPTVNANATLSSCSVNAASVSLGTPVTGDNCSILSVTNDAPGAYPVGTTIVTWTATDVNGNSSTCQQQVIVTDIEPPIISSCGAVGNQNVVADLGTCRYTQTSTGWDAIASDNCTVSSIMYVLSGATTGTGSSLNGVVFNLGTTTVVWTVLDASGNSSMCTFDVSVTDDQNPIISSCGATGTQNVNADFGVCSYTNSGIAWNANATDNCSLASLTYSLSGATTGTGTSLNGVSFNLGSTTVTWTATDNAGNISVCTFDVIVSDTQNPIIISCGGVGTQTVNANSGVCAYTQTGNGWNATATDNCSIASSVYNLTGATTGSGTTLNGVSFNLGTTTVTWTITDGSGNTATCVFDVTVVDNQVPVIVNCGALANQNVNADAGVCYYTNTGTGWNAVASDNCTISTLTYTLTGATSGTGTSLDGVTFNLGFTVVTWTATDGAGNTATCAFNVTVIDNQNPTISSCGATGNQNVVVDVASCHYTHSGTGWNATATDNCTVSSISYTLTGATNGSGTSLNGVSFNLGTTTVTWTVTDGTGNTSTCTFDVIVADTQLPDISSCGPSGNQTVNANVGTCTYTYSGTGWNASATDNCTISSITYTLTGATTGSGTSLNGVVFNLGTTTVTWTVTDGAGNSDQCAFDVTVVDDQNPAITSCGAAGNQNVVADLGVCNYTNSGTGWDATATDNCTVSSITYTLTGATTGTGTTLDGVVFNLGTTTVTWTITDGSGNSDQCTFDVIVTDTELPVIIGCPTDININNSLGSCGNTATWTAPSFTDNCGGSMTASHNPGDYFPVGTTVVTYTVTDGSGNIVTCSFNVTVTDSELPQMTCQANYASCDPLFTFTTPAATDNCGVISVTQTGGLVSGSTFPIGTTTITFEALDVHGNVSTCSFDVTIHPTPVATTVGTDVSCFGSNDGSIDLTVTTGTMPYSFNWSNGATTEDINGLAPNAYTVFITDANGCQTSAQETITEPTQLVLNKQVTQVSCFGGSNGAIDLTISGGTLPYTYAWNNGSTSEDLSGVTAGSYSVTVTDANGCQVNNSTVIIQPTQIEVIGSVTDATCNAANGSIQVLVTGGTTPYDYLWSNGSTTTNLTNVIGGVYTLTVTDANGCSFDFTDTVGVSANLNASLNIQDALCFGQENGSAVAIITSGTAPYSYLWSNGSNTQSASNLGAGIYDVIITDAFGCQVSLNFMVDQPDSLYVTLTPSIYNIENGYNVTGNGEEDGYILSDVQGGTPDYTYSWSTIPAETTADLYNVGAGNYTLTVMDANGCSANASVRLIEPEELRMPEGVSPNGDGDNDFFVVKGLEAYPENDITIYNRWGNIVYQLNGYQNNWEGQNTNNQPLPDGTYFVVLNAYTNSATKTLTGYIDLRRSR